MALPRWALPEHFEDVLPFDARRIEVLRRALLDDFRLHGYQLVMPPMVEHLDSLAEGTGQDMIDRTFALPDQLSGRTLGLRADITPQITRIDAHQLNRRGVARLCYCGSVVHTVPRSLAASREPIQIGAELYGHAGIEADEEILRLMAGALARAELSHLRIDLGHVGIFRALARMAELNAEAEEQLFAILQAKDVPALQQFVAGMPDALRAALLALPGLYGGADVLVKAASVLPQTPAVRDALEDLLHLAKRLHDLPVSFDLADLRGYHYHTGLVFAAYCGNSPAAIALGGRYNESGEAFGRARSATGFSLDLRDLVLAGSTTAQEQGAVLAPASSEQALLESIAALRAAGTAVVIELPGHSGAWREAGCDRRLELRNGTWQVVPLVGD